jgi:hypothetical protein
MMTGDGTLYTEEIQDEEQIEALGKTLPFHLKLFLKIAETRQKDEKIILKVQMLPKLPW